MIMKKAAILAAGEGSRLKSISFFKPLTKINGRPLIDITYENLHFRDFTFVNIIFNEEQKAMDLTRVSSVNANGINVFFKNTPSSMHSLFEVYQKQEIETGEHLFVSMVDSIVHPDDAKGFHSFCQGLRANESAIMATSFVEDEKPLTLAIDINGYVSEFQCPLVQNETFVTSGVYYFSEEALSMLPRLINNGKGKMRNFLNELIYQKHPVKVFKVKKTLDIDRPEDIKSAEYFLTETQT
jgi:choline kinase